jgi:hypothetical protein
VGKLCTHSDQRVLSEQNAAAVRSLWLYIQYLKWKVQIQQRDRVATECN